MYRAHTRPLHSRLFMDVRILFTQNCESEKRNESEEDETHNRFYGITEWPHYSHGWIYSGFLWLLHDRTVLFGCRLELFPAELIIKSYEVL